MKSMAEKLGKNPAAVLVRWAIQHGTSGALTVLTVLLGGELAGTTL